MVFGVTQGVRWPRARFSKVPVTFRPEIKYSNRIIKNKSAGPGQQTTPFCVTN